MRRTSASFVVVAGLFMALGVATLPSAQESRSETFSGSYDWKQGGSDELSAEFTPAGEPDEWKVVFRFRWSGNRKTWKGTAEGSLEDGSTLTGTATSGGRNWIFEAEIADGVMRGTHTEVKGAGGGYKTGTFEVKR